MERMASIELDVWIDLISPTCYVAKRRLEAAVAASPHPSEVSVTYRSLELDPDVPRGGDGTAFTQQARLHGVSEEEVRATLEWVAIDARPDGIVIDLDALLPANTLDAHRLLAAALDLGGPALQSAALERLYAAYFAEGRAIDDPAVLLRLGAEAGVDERRLGATLATDDYLEAVRADEAAAGEAGVTSVPFVMAAGQPASAGLQTVEGFSRVLGLASGQM